MSVGPGGLYSKVVDLADPENFGRQNRSKTAIIENNLKRKTSVSKLARTNSWLILIFSGQEADIKKLETQGYIFIILLFVKACLAISALALTISKDEEKSLDNDDHTQSTISDNRNKQATSIRVSVLPVHVLTKELVWTPWTFRELLSAFVLHLILVTFVNMVSEFNCTKSGCCKWIETCLHHGRGRG